MIIDREVAKAIRNATSSELTLIINLIKERQKSLEREKAVSFVIGEKVEFDAGRRGYIKGSIMKINSKTIQVKQTDGLGVTWKVSPTLLKKVA